MIFTSSDGIFDTLNDTYKNCVTVKTRISIRKDVQVDGKCPLYLNIAGNARRINLKIYVDPKLWWREKNRLKAINSEMADINLILDNIDAKITSIKTSYRLAELHLTPELLEDEFLNKLSKVNFIAFFKKALEIESSKLSKGSYNRHLSVYRKLFEYKSFLPFNEITLQWLDKYRYYLKFTLKNQDTTIAANMASIKKFLIIAQENGIKLLFDVKKMEVGDTKGNRVHLNEAEIHKLFKYYKSEFINDNSKLVLGYFLFGCMTGLRMSNIQKLERKDLLSNDFSFVNAKSRNDKNLMLNNKCKDIISSNQNLFVKKFSDQYLNKTIRKITISCGITKHVSFHVARHTFATLFLKMGGKVEMLQMLLGHSTITQTMIYVHIVQSEANKEIFLLDNLF